MLNFPSSLFPLQRRQGRRHSCIWSFRMWSNAFLQKLTHPAPPAGPTTSRASPATRPLWRPTIPPSLRRTCAPHPLLKQAPCSGVLLVRPRKPHCESTKTRSQVSHFCVDKGYPNHKGSNAVIQDKRNLVFLKSQVSWFFDSWLIGRWFFLSIFPPLFLSRWYSDYSFCFKLWCLWPHASCFKRLRINRDTLSNVGENGGKPRREGRSTTDLNPKPMATASNLQCRTPAPQRQFLRPFLSHFRRLFCARGILCCP